MVSLGKDKFLATYNSEEQGLIIIDWEVTGQIMYPDGLRMNNPFTVPNFDLDTFPFVIVNDTYKSKISLINIKEKTI